MSRQALCSLVLLALAAGAEGGAVGLPPLDVNVAATASPCDPQVFTQIKGVGNSLAEKICARGAGFNSVWELGQISGIGDTTITNAVAGGGLVDSSATQYRVPCVANATATPAGKTETDCMFLARGNSTTGALSGLPYIDINKASEPCDLEALQQIKYISSPAKAQAVCDLRVSGADFSSIFVLDGVSGIGAAKVRKMVSGGGNLAGTFRVPCVETASGTPTGEHETACYPLKDSAYTVDNAPWTAWFDADKPTGTGDIETYNIHKHANNVCGRSETGGDTKPIDIECRLKEQSFNGTVLASATLLADLPQGSLTAQTVTCNDPAEGLTCYNSQNQKCWGPNPACALANDATTASNAGAAYHNVSNATSRCHESEHLGCIWGCADYEVRFKCEKHWTAVPTVAPTPSPTVSPTLSPTVAPSTSPTPAPSPRGNHASRGIDTIPAMNRLRSHDFQSCQEALTNSHWTPNFNVDTSCATDDASIIVKSKQATGTPGIVANLVSAQNEQGADIIPNKWYVVIVKGWAPHGAYPNLRCANTLGQRQNILWRVGTTARAFGIPNGEHGYDNDPVLDQDKHGYSINFVKESHYTKDCTFGVLMHSYESDLYDKEMQIDYAEVRLALDYEVRDLETEVGVFGTADQNYPEHLKGRTANNNFQLGLQGFRSAAGESKARMWLTPSVDTAKGSTGATVFVTEAVSTASANPLNGLRQNKITVVPGNNYTFEVKGKFSPKIICNEPSSLSVTIPTVGSDLPFTKDSNGVWRYVNGATSYSFVSVSGTWELHSSSAGVVLQNQGHGSWPTDQCAILSGASGTSTQTAKLWIGDSSGSYTTNLKWSSSSVPTIAEGSVSLDFVAPDGGMIDLGVLISDSEVDDALTVTKFDLRPRDTLDEHAVQTAQVSSSTCACSPLLHPSMVTRCTFTHSPSDQKRHRVLRVVHQKEHNGKADFHRCADVGTAASPKCSCCDCLNGQLHSGSNKFDINMLKSAQSFHIAFNNFTTTEANNNFNIFANMHAQCRYKIVSGGVNEWCCQCTSGNCGTLSERLENDGVGEFGSATESCSPEDVVPDYITVSVGCDNPAGTCSKAGRPYAFSHHNTVKQVFDRNGVAGLYDVFDEVRAATQDDEFTVTSIQTAA